MFSEGDVPIRTPTPPKIVTKDGQPVTRDGLVKYEIRVWDNHLGKQHNRTAYGEEQALAVQAGLLAMVKLPLEQRPVSERVSQAQARERANIPAQRTANTSTLTVRAWSVTYLELYKKKQDGKERPFSSWAHDKRCLDIYILPNIGDRVLQDVRLSELDDLILGLTKLDGMPLGGHTRESVAGTIKRMWKMARRRDVLVDNVAEALSSSWGGMSEERRTIIPSVLDVEALGRAMDALSEGLGDVVRLMAYTGMRWAEASAACVEDIDWSQRTISVCRTATSSGGRRVESTITKSKAGRREVPIPGPLVEPLHRLIALSDMRRREHNREGARLIVTGRRGGPLSYGVWRKYLDRGRADSGVSYTAHPLRHVAASLAIASGMSDREVARMMGHANVEFTRKVYGHLFPQDHRGTADAMTAVIEAMAEQETAVRRLRAVS